MINALIIFLLREKRNLLNSKFLIPIRLLTSFLTLYFYFIASKALKFENNSFPPNFLNDWSLFEFIVIGEITLYLVSDSLIIYAQQTKVIIDNHCLDPLLNTRTNIVKIILLLGFSSYSLSIITILFDAFILHFIFSLSYSVENLVKAIFLNILFLPIFISLGLITSAFLIIFKRGIGILGFLLTFLGVLSGAYFPIDFFPSNLVNVITSTNPLQFLVHTTRLLLKGNELTVRFEIILISLLFVSVMLFIIAYFSIGLAVKIYKKKGEVLILTH